MANGSHGGRVLSLNDTVEGRESTRWDERMSFRRAGPGARRSELFARGTRLGPSPGSR
ncbi:hypothetical protein GCM10011583_36170 [Streptomyces camponoticapitis]|uniref:Uncharacterized protein n=1 Tax=Streptomyces camponoticapitis TaxID=1616125 RepID=A0ABQ2E915_9ACTN|nr:hypothetical protein GCM10011583_36170 [Streptomyces camponoticapitis]